MKSIKPGRGPSGMGAIGSVIAAVFGVFWTFTAIQMKAPFFFPLFGIIFIVMAIVQGIYNYKNYKNKNRFSLYDITENEEEIDPIQQKIIDKYGDDYKSSNTYTNADKFCPYCGAKAEGDYEFCMKCGNKFPK